MSVYETEEEQIEAIKAWWKRNGKSIIAGVLLGVAVVVGGKVWLGHQHQRAAEASAQYQILIDALDKDDTGQVLQQGERLTGQYADTPYAALAALAMAKIKLEQGKPDEARAQLQWVIEHAKQADLKHIARLRQAKILFAGGKGDQALTLLNSGDPGTFKAAFEELKGDIYTRQGKRQLARNAYETALAGMPQGVSRKYLKMKLDDLGAKDDS